MAYPTLFRAVSLSLYIYIYIYIYRERERRGDRDCVCVFSSSNLNFDVSNFYISCVWIYLINTCLANVYTYEIIYKKDLNTKNEITCGLLHFKILTFLLLYLQQSYILSSTDCFLVWQFVSVARRVKCFEPRSRNFLRIFFFFFFFLHIRFSAPWMPNSWKELCILAYVAAGNYVYITFHLKFSSKECIFFLLQETYSQEDHVRR